MGKNYSEIPLGNQPERMHRGALTGAHPDERAILNDAEHVQSVIGRLTGRPVTVRHPFGQSIPTNSELLSSNDEEE